MIIDYVVVGAGLTGATIARHLVDAGRKVMVVERRSHTGGNVHDFIHDSGIRVHTYGPHYFRTNSKRIWNFVNRFAAFQPFAAVVMTEVHGRLVNWPVPASYISSVSGANWEPVFRGVPSNFEEACLAEMPREVYETFIRGYTEKQWGVPAHTLTPGLAKRIEIRVNGDPRLCLHRWQGLPRGGYEHFVRELLRGIPVILNCDYLFNREVLRAKQQVIFTGPIDEFFGYDLGRLEYRAQRREHTYEPTKSYHQPVIQVNNPGKAAGPHIRTIEWKHLLPPDIARNIRGTLLTTETPFTPINPAEYEYPFPDERNQRLYRLYRARAEGLSNTVIAGRLGEYRYYDMDQAIARAIHIAEQLLGRGNVNPARAVAKTTTA